MRQVSYLFLFVLLAFTIFRVTRFVTSDDLIQEPRDAVWSWLMLHGMPDPPENRGWSAPLWRRKLSTLIECAWCASIWVSGLTVIVLLWVVDYDIPLPLFWWPALSGAAVILQEFTDGEKLVAVRQNPEKH